MIVDVSTPDRLFCIQERLFLLAVKVEIAAPGSSRMQHSTCRERDIYVTPRPDSRFKGDVHVGATPPRMKTSFSEEIQMATAKSITQHPAMQTIEAWRQQVETQVNVPPPERLVSTIGGGVLAFSGLSRRSWFGTLQTIVGGFLLYRGITGHSFVYQALRINRAEHPFPSINITSIPDREGFRLQRSLTILRPPQDLYAFCRNVENVPHYIPSIESVRKINENWSHWVATSPTGQRMEWEIEITQDQPGRWIGWQVHNKSIIGNTGLISFREVPRQRGTVTSLEVDFVGHKGLQNTLEIPLIGRVTGLFLESWILETLRRFKALMETGEVPTLTGQPTGRPVKQAFKLAPVGSTVSRLFT